MKALIATDGTDDAIRGAKRALPLLQPDIDVVVAVVVPEREDPLMTASGFAGPLVTEDEATAEHTALVALGEDALERTVAAIEQLHVTAPDDLETRLITSMAGAAEAIVAEADRSGADVIVIGSTGKGTWRRFFSGSVSEKVAREAACPVLICPPETDESD